LVLNLRKELSHWRIALREGVMVVSIKSRRPEQMGRVTSVTAPILLADIGDYCFGMFTLDLKSGDKRIFGIHGYVVGLSV
jgi:hypothetical protein